MKTKNFFTALMLMFVCAGTCTICSCSKDNGENLDIHVIVNEDGTTSNGSIFSAIDNRNFYVDYIKYTVTDYYLSVSGYDKKKFNGVAKIISKLTYKGHTFEVLEIGDYAFDDCRGLTSVTIPNSVTRIGWDAFEDCDSLTSVHITDLAAWCKIDFGNSDSNPLTCAHHLYMNGQELKDLVIPNSVTSIGDHAFSGCSGLTSVTIPNSVTSIGSGAFGDCTGLTSVTIPNSVTSIEDFAFDGCTALTSVTIPNSVTNIGISAFYGCSGLTSITIPNSVTSIENFAFWGCTGLTSVHITDLAAWCKIDFGNYDSNPLTCAHHLYMNGQEIKDLVIPNSVTSIGSGAFWGGTGLTSVTIPNSVTSIGKYAFAGCKGLTSVTIPNSVTSIEDFAFDGCTALTSVTIPNSVTSIGSGAFGDCTGLTSVTIPNSVTSIGKYAFDDCKGLTSVTIPNSVTSIGDYAFVFCTGLTDVWCYAEEPPMGNAFNVSSISTATLHVPAASLGKYRAKEPWKNFRKIVAL